MSRRAKGVTAFAIILVLAAAWWASQQRRETVRLRVVAANDAKAQELMRDIDRRFAVGTSETQILEFLRREHPDYGTVPSGTRTEYWVPIGQEPSNVWYCGSFMAYVSLECVGGRFSRTRITRWSNDCP